MDNRTKKLLCALRKDALVSMRSLSKKTDIPVPSLYYKLKKLKKHEIIRKSTILLNFKRLGYPLQILLFIVLDNAKDIRYFMNSEHLNTVFELDNKNSFIIECLFTSGADADKFITDFEEKTKPKKVLFWQVKNELMKEGFLSEQFVGV